MTYGVKSIWIQKAGLIEAQVSKFQIMKDEAPESQLSCGMNPDL